MPLCLRTAQLWPLGFRWSGGGRGLVAGPSVPATPLPPWGPAGAKVEVREYLRTPVPRDPGILGAGGGDPAEAGLVPWGPLWGGAGREKWWPPLPLPASGVFRRASWGFPGGQAWGGLWGGTRGWGLGPDPEAPLGAEGGDPHAAGGAPAAPLCPEAPCGPLLLSAPPSAPTEDLPRPGTALLGEDGLQRSPCRCGGHQPCQRSSGFAPQRQPHPPPWVS